ncbi:MAG: zf-TFIIB domain-containing protein [Geobacteraceae bacterium]|nr:zf-TFIIB domain-containing protein [Geobacteraceae bacterium]
MKCPVCPAVNLVMSERQGVEIDYCPECRGVWLDRGELDKIIERSASQELTPPSQPPQYAPQPPRYAPQQNGYAPGHGHGHGHFKEQKPYRKKSFLEELFD